MKEQRNDMLSEELRKALDAYIKEHYVEEEITDCCGISDSMLIIGQDEESDTAKASGKNFSNKESFSLNDILNEVGESFHERLFMYIDMSGMTDVEVYKRANIDRKLFSKIRSNPSYHPRKQTVLALAIALRLSMEDTVDLLARAEYALSPGNKGDLIIRYFIEHGIYDIMVINFALDEYGLPVLGS